MLGGGELVKFGRMPSFEVGKKKRASGTLLMSRTGFYANMFLKMICPSWLILLLQKYYKVQVISDYLLEDGSHMAHGEQRLWHLGCSLIRLWIPCWLLALADNAWGGPSPDYSRLGRALADIPWVVPGMFWRHFLLSSPFLHHLFGQLYMPGESCLLSTVSFQLTVDSIIELKKGAYFHSLWSFRIREFSL